MNTKITYLVSKNSRVVVLIIIAGAVCVFYFLFSIFSIFYSPPVSAQSNTDIIITWHANNFYPSDYRGRALPSIGSPVLIAAEVVENGKLKDLRGAKFSWFINDKPYQTKTGLKEILIKTVGGDGFFTVRTRITLSDDVFEKSLRIPVVTPRVVIDAPYPNHLARTKSKIQLYATPYFFNVSSMRDLLMFWSINNSRQESEPGDNRLTINLAEISDTKKLKINVLAQNETNPLETVKDFINLTVMK